MLDALSATTVPIYPALGQALNNAGLYTNGLTIIRTTTTTTTV